MSSFQQIVRSGSGNEPKRPPKTTVKLSTINNNNNRGAWVFYPKGAPNNPYYTDPTHVNWGFDGCFCFVMIAFILLFVGLFLIVWFVPYYGYPAYPPPLPPSKETVMATQLITSDGGGGGHSIPGLDNVDALSIKETPSSQQCPPWETFNSSAMFCQPRVVVPVGVDMELVDPNVHHCHSFFNHSCGAWLNWNRPKLKTRADRSFGYLQRLNEYTRSQIIDRRLGQNDPIFFLYQSCVDALVTRHQEEQQKEYRDYLFRHVIEPIREMSDLPLAFGKLMEIGFTVPITITVEENPVTPEMVPFFGCDGFNTTISSNIKPIFLTAFSEEKAQQKTDLFIALNRMLEAQRPLDVANTMNEYVQYLEGPQFTQDMMYYQDVLRLIRPMFNIDVMLNYLGLSFPNYHNTWIRTKSHYRWLFSSYGPMKMQYFENWKAYLEFSILYSSVDFFPNLPQNVFIKSKIPRGRGPNDTPEDEYSGSMKRVPIGSSVSRQDCMRMTEQLLPGHMSKALFEVIGPSESMRTRVFEMAERIRNRMQTMVSQQEWMTAHDKRETLKKLQAIIIRVAKPNGDIFPVEPFGSQLTANNFNRNLEHIRRYRVKRQWDRWNAQSDQLHQLNRDDIQRFQAPLSLVNAMYSPITNTITIYGGILQYPFVHDLYDDATMYATIGTVIGHELSHALDPVGRRFDKDGSFHATGRLGWWQHATVEEYERRIFSVINEYGSPDVTRPLMSQCPEVFGTQQQQQTNLYGQHTITEDVADLLGVRAAYEAYFLDIDAAASMSKKQHFFYSFSQMWCSVATPEYECALIKRDVHAVPRVRVDSTLRNLEYFQDVFQCPAHSYMNKPQNEIVRVF
jgi:predicted metalloendopeptidase